MDKPVFSYTIYIGSTPEKVWAGLTQEEFTQKYWNVKLATDWKVGSRIELFYKGELYDAGEILIYEPYIRLSYSWKHMHFPDVAIEPASRVTFELEQLGSQVKLSLVHDQFEPGSKLYQGISGGWPSVFSGLKTLLETGKVLGEPFPE